VSRRWLWVASALLLLAALSALGPTTPGYDPWAWLIWGREIGHLDLDTVDGPAFKPLPVAITAVLAPLGDAAPTIWVILARAGALWAIAAAGTLAYRLAAGPGMPAGTYVMEARRRPQARWWQVGMRLSRTLGRRWWGRPPRRTRGRPDGARVGPARHDLVHVRAAGRAAVIAVIAAAGTTGLVWQSWQGNSEGLATAFGVLAVERGLGGHHRAALGFALGICLLRVEAWPFAAVYGAHLFLTRPAWRPALLALVVGVLVLWFGPELWGSGDLLRASDRARVPNPGQPALADVPALASLGDALALPAIAALVAAALGAATVRPGTLIPFVLGLMWLGLVAAMAQAGFSGEERYHVPGAVMLGVAGAVAIAGTARRRDPRWALVAAVLTVATSCQAGWRAAGIDERLDRSRHTERLTDDLRDAIDRAGGRAAVLRCGRPVTGTYRGPLVAWHLRVHKQRVAFDPRAPGTGAVLRSPLTERAIVEPVSPPARGRRVVRAGLWEISLPRRC
jgi:hypothetical protein